MNGMMFGGLARMMNGQAPQFGFRAMFNKHPGMTNDGGMAPQPPAQPQGVPFGGKDMRQVNPGPPLSTLLPHEAQNNVGMYHQRGGELVGLYGASVRWSGGVLLMDKEQFRDHVLRQLGVIGARETPSGDDADLMETIIDNCHSELEQQEVALWSVDDIPAYAIEGFALYCKATCTAWGQEYDPRLQELAIRRLRTVTADKRAGVGKATYF